MCICRGNLGHQALPVMPTFAKNISQGNIGNHIVTTLGVKIKVRP